MSLLFAVFKPHFASVRNIVYRTTRSFSKMKVHLAVEKDSMPSEFSSTINKTDFCSLWVDKMLQKLEKQEGNLLKCFRKQLSY